MPGIAGMPLLFGRFRCRSFLIVPKLNDHKLNRSHAQSRLSRRGLVLRVFSAGAVSPSCLEVILLSVWRFRPRPPRQTRPPTAAQVSTTRHSVLYDEVMTDRRRQDGRQLYHTVAAWQRLCQTASEEV